MMKRSMSVNKRDRRASSKRGKAESCRTCDREPGHEVEEPGRPKDQVLPRSKKDARMERSHRAVLRRGRDVINAMF